MVGGVVRLAAVCLVCAAADFYHFMFVVVLFGVAITYGWQMKRSILAESIGTN